MTKFTYTDIDLPGLQFTTLKCPGIVFKIKLISSGLCHITWDGGTKSETYATEWVKIYLDRGDWIAKH